MANKNIIIVGRDGAMSRIIYDVKARTTKAKDFDAVVSSDVKGVTRINALSAVVQTMEQLAEQDLSKEPSPVQILTLGLVADMIKNGTALYWSKNDNKKADGTAVHETEAELWARFYELMQEGLLTEVIFKDVSDIKINPRSKYPVTSEQRILNEYIEKAWDRVKVTAPEISEEEDDAI